MVQPMAQRVQLEITFQRFALPEDCIEVLGYVDRDDDRGKA
jgi:hypothetical protein